MVMILAGTNGYVSAKRSLSDDNNRVVKIDDKDDPRTYVLIDVLYNGVIVREKGNIQPTYFPWSRIVRIDYR